MADFDINYLECNGLFAYKYIRGSWLHGIAIEGKSDYDYSGVFFVPHDTLLGLRSRYVEQISDKRNDQTYYEFGRWMELLLKSNPTVLESLFVDKKFIMGDVHPVIQNIIDKKEKFLTKEAFNPLIGYATTQISKARGYNKKCMYPENMSRRGLLDFCYTFEKQGSIPFTEWLNERGLKQEYCGLVNVPNMFEMYAVFYDWGNHILNCGCNLNMKGFYYSIQKNSAFDSSITAKQITQIEDIKPIGYSGIVSRGDNESTEVRLSSVAEGDMPICHMQFSKNAYQSHCRIYKDWADWKENRNEERYNDNKGFNYDAKNMCECVRLLHTGIEIAKGEGFNTTRTWDRDFLLNIKSHKYTYNELIEYVKDKKNEFESYYKSCTLPDAIDKEFVNKLLIESRKEYYNETEK